MSGLMVLVLQRSHRARILIADLLVFFPELSPAQTFPIERVLLSISNASPRSMHHLHMMPRLTGIVCLWLILSQLIRSLRQLKGLSASLKTSIDEKPRALEASCRS